MSNSIEIQPVRGPLQGRVRPPGSKSITNRAVVCAALANGTSTLTGALDSEDTRVMLESLSRLGFEVETCDSHQTLKVRGTGGVVPALEADLFCANSGTTLRFLTALATLGHGYFRLDGVARMRERPVDDLLEALNQLGGNLRSELNNGCPPVIIHANGLTGGHAKLRGDISSQFLSALLMAAPAARSPIELVIDGPLVSKPYILMTEAVMKSFGVTIELDESLSRFTSNSPQQYSARDYEIEPDASAASYFWAAAAICGGDVTVDGLSSQSLQGDVGFVSCLEQMGCVVKREANSISVGGRPLQGIDVDMNAISDTVQTLAVVALFAQGTTRIRNVKHIRHKETDRISAVAIELRKLGAHVDESDDGLEIHPNNLQSAAIDTYRDHRMAMSFALAGLRIPGVHIRDPGCVDKTYPRYFEDLAKLTGSA
ncbi:MAG TPA: 3-phosphoshikimate 1-carboxyvinyltransferase [Lacipirellulaceae bacterium]|jgi:3-phosphoshikimate 1-carboxyvinyltransferase|nr:3-phosphoshikimate 1-carboxyvinyltransferase [Lacipirellulaceae bacterium]